VKLHWSPKSPFVRKVMITAHECGLTDRIELVRTVAAMRRPTPVLMSDNPLNKIPTLVLDDGSRLYDSDVICEFLDDLAPVANRAPLFPRDRALRWDALRRNALGSGLLDVLILWRNERERAAPSSELIKAFAQKTQAALATIAEDLASAPADRFDIGDIAIVCALAYLDFRFGDFDWRENPMLDAWYERIKTRPSVQATSIVDDRATIAAQ
jgi:glutathione S-transferase